jgi:hypothetical protein
MAYVCSYMLGFSQLQHYEQAGPCHPSWAAACAGVRRSHAMGVHSLPLSKHTIIRLPAQLRCAAHACMASLVDVWWAWVCSCGCSQCVLNVHPFFSSHITRCRSSTQAAQDGVGCLFAALLLYDILHAASPLWVPFLCLFLLAAFAALQGHASCACCFVCLILWVVCGGRDCMAACGLSSTLLGVHLASCCCWPSPLSPTTFSCCQHL